MLQVRPGLNGQNSNPMVRGWNQMSLTQTSCSKTFTHSFNKQLLRICYVLDLRLGTGATGMNKTNQGSHLLDTYSVAGTVLDCTLELTRELLQSQGSSQIPGQLDPSLCRWGLDTINF